MKHSLLNTERAQACSLQYGGLSILLKMQAHACGGADFARRFA
jgi:hypothetical protein